MRRLILKEDKQSAETASWSSLLALPYDIRYLIYQHAFPSGRQIYIQAYENTLLSITNEGIPTALLRTCKSLNREAGEYLYNNYLFNLVGRKQDCLKHYEQCRHTMEKYTGTHVNVDAFSNGDHSKTMAIALHAGEGKVEMLKRRERGLRKTIQELKEEVNEAKPTHTQARRNYFILRSLAFVMWASLIGLLAWLPGAY